MIVTKVIALGVALYMGFAGLLAIVRREAPLTKHSAFKSERIAPLRGIQAVFAGIAMIAGAALIIRLLVVP